MLPLEELTEQILDRDDGSCRDVNFDCLDWSGAESVLQSLLDDASFATATDGDGQNIDVFESRASEICLRARDTRSCHVLLTDVDDLFQSLQVFVCPEEDGTPFVELTFFPDDLNPALFTTERLLDKLIGLSTLGRASNFFLRYENASWQHGATGPGTGVIATWHELRDAE